MKVKRLDIEDITKVIEPFSKMQTSQWFLTTAECDNEVRTLTCAWGAFGNVWHKKTMTIYIRPQRNTLPFIEKAGKFSATFFDGYIKEMSYLGTVSGKDVPNKIELSGLNIEHIDGYPTFKEGQYVVLCKVLYQQRLDENLFVDKSILNRSYPNKDYSYMIVGEIEAFYQIEKE